MLIFSHKIIKISIGSTKIQKFSPSGGPLPEVVLSDEQSTSGGPLCGAEIHKIMKIYSTLLHDFVPP